MRVHLCACVCECERERARARDRDILEDIVKKQTDFMNRVLVDNLDSKEKEEISKENVFYWTSYLSPRRNKAFKRLPKIVYLSSYSLNGRMRLEKEP